MRVILATDFSPASNAVIDEFKSRSWPAGSEALLLHVVDVMVGGPGRMDLTPYIQKETVEAKVQLKTIAAQLSTASITVSTDVIDGHSAVLVADYAKDWNADLIMVGSHGQNALTRFLLGSVAASTLRHAHCSVELVRPRAAGRSAAGMRLLLATDGSEHSKLAAQSIARLPWPKDSEIEILSVAGFSTPPIGSEYVPPTIVDKLLDDSLKESWGLVEQSKLIIEPTGLKIFPKVITGLPKAVIVAEADDWRADLVILGSHGRRGLERILVGSVSESVAIHAHCSVEVVRRQS